MDKTECIRMFNILDVSRNPEKLIEWLMKLGLIGKKYICVDCEEEMKLVEMETIDGYAWQCTKLNGIIHEVTRSIRIGSIFERSKLSLKTILLLSYMWLTGYSEENIMREIKVSPATIKDWSQFFKELCMEMCVRSQETIGGLENIVQIEVSKFEEPMYTGGYRTDGSWVIFGFDRGTGKWFMVAVEEKSKDVYFEVILKFIEPGTTLLSDCWSEYNYLEDEDFQYMTTNHSIKFKDFTPNVCRKGTKRLPQSYAKGDFKLDFYVDMWQRKHKGSKCKMRKFISALNEIYIPPEADP